MNGIRYLTRILPLDGRYALTCIAAMLLGTSIASAQQAGELITPNFRDADITQIAEAVSMATGKNFIIDPRVRAQVTMLSATPMSPDAFYEAFLSILQVHGFMASKTGNNIIQIVPDANARLLPSNDLPDRVSSSSAEIVTQVIPVRNVSAAQLVPILRPLIPQQGHLAAYPAGNILIISDRANNVNRIMRIVQRIDQQGDSDVEIIALQNASASEVVRVINSLQQGQAQQDGGGPGGPASLKLVADERSNSVLISGEPAVRLRTRTLITYLDTPLEAGGDTRVRYLQYADAEKIATKLKEQVTGIAQAAAPAGGAQGAPPPSQQIDKSTTIWADPQTNALVVTAPPKVMKQLMSVVDRLDIRRLQVLVEAIIVDLSINKNAELGVNWAVFSDDDDNRIPLGTFLGPIGGSSLVDLVNTVDNPANADPDLATGTTIGIGRIAQGSGVSFAAMLRALRNDDDTNIIGTPSALTMDNEEAEIKVAQEVPFRTGQFTNTGGTTNGSVNPFTTIERQEVGTILKITPQINEGGTTVMLKLELESSSIATTQQTGAADLITNKRTINTNVLIEDGGIVVLGGLIQDNYRRGESRVPFLGRIPVIGLAFRTRNSNSGKSNLMFFIRPKIIRDGVDVALETDSKYRFIREQQRKIGKRELLPLLPGEKPPILPPLPPPPIERPNTPLPPSETPENDAESEAQKKRPQTAPAEQPQAAPQPSPAQPPREDGNE